MKRSKKWIAAHEKLDVNKEYGLKEALQFVKDNAGAKFDESVDISVGLGVDPKKSDQVVRGAVVLPGGRGKVVRVLVFAQGAKADEAKAAGADIVGANDLVEKISGGWDEFDSVIATPDMMGVVGKLGKILGPRGLMPNPKVGTVTNNLTTAINEVRAGKVEFRTDKSGIIHASIGKVSFDADKLFLNIKALVDALTKLKPSTAKGVYVHTAHVSSTMGQGVKINVSDLR
ncbi:MAG: 50S ribosomal protein L1 [Chitinispirillales bacterium]|jgi:large subunit ribosomal protein L1|nr:50S ribosomal protein L1 [Chitinispirillales bacterium]